MLRSGEADSSGSVMERERRETAVSPFPRPYPHTDAIFRTSPKARLAWFAQGKEKLGIHTFFCSFFHLFLSHNLLRFISLFILINVLFYFRLLLRVISSQWLIISGYRNF